MNMTRGRRGLSLVEVMMSISITVVIMFAMFQALTASFNAFRVNQSQGMLTMRTRMVLMRMLDHIRATNAHEPKTSAKKDDFVAAGEPVNDNGIVLSETQSDGSKIIFTYWLDTSNAANNQLKMTRAPGNGSTIATSNTVLLNGVSTFKVTMWSGKSDPVNMATNDILLQATIILQANEQTRGQVTGYRITGSNATPDSVTLCGSSVPRQNAWSGQDLSFTIKKILTQTH